MMKLNNLIEDNVVREDCNYILKKTNLNKFKNSKILIPNLVIVCFIALVFKIPLLNLGIHIPNFYYISCEF